ncbi:MAG: hypothetical protein R2742_14970 [Micropruina glycogenica]
MDEARRRPGAAAAGRTEAELVAVTRAKLLRSPVLLPTWGWIDDNSDSEDDEAKRSRLNPYGQRPTGAGG